MCYGGEPSCSNGHCCSGAGRPPGLKPSVQLLQALASASSGSVRSSSTAHPSYLQGLRRHTVGTVTPVFIVTASADSTRQGQLVADVAAVTVTARREATPRARPLKQCLASDPRIRVFLLQHLHVYCKSCPQSWTGQPSLPSQELWSCHWSLQVQRSPFPCRNVCHVDHL